jgi:DNA-binding MarR family transcriptional regulator
VNEPRWLDEREARMWRAFHEMRRHLDKAVERQLAEAGLSAADYNLLVPLSQAPGDGLRSRDLAKHVDWDRSRLSHQLRRMEQRGLITRRDCPGDARGTMITLATAGRSAVEAAAPGHVETVRRHFVDLLSSEEIDTLTAIATRIRDNAAGTRPPADPQP